MGFFQDGRSAMEAMIKFADQKCIINLAGTLTYDDHFSMASTLKSLKEKNFNQLTICLSSLDFIDTAGLALLLLAEQFAHDQNCDVSFTFPQGQVRDMLCHTHLINELVQETSPHPSPATVH